MDLFDLARTVAALLFVLGLILGLSWLARRQGWVAGIPASAKDRRLQVCETLMIDPRNKVILLQADGRDYLLAIGPQGQAVTPHEPLAKPQKQPQVSVIEGGK